MKNFLNDITVILGSVTKASKARRILSGGGIESDLIKSAKIDTGECAHGIRIKESDMYRAALILRKHDIEYTVENDISR